MFHALVRRTALVLFGLVTPLLCVELALRFFGPVLPGNYETGVWAEGHPTVGHVHIPGATAWVREPEFTTFLRFNQWGLRGDEIRVPKSPDRYRVVILGDSFVEGKQVAEGDTVVEQINTLLAQGGRSDVRALNAGVFDWSQVHEYLYLQEAAPMLRPDLVVQFLYVGNDIGDVWPRSRAERRSLQRPVALVDDGQLLFAPWHRRDASLSDQLLESVSRRSATWRAFETGVMDKIRYRNRDGQGIEGQMLELLRHKETPAETQAWQTAEALLRATRDTAIDAGARYAIVVVPTKWQVHRKDWQQLLAARGERDDDRWVLRGPQRRLVHMATSLGVPVLDLMPAMREADAKGQRLYYAVDTHWRAEGHALAARSVVDFLQEENLIGQRR